MEYGATELYCPIAASLIGMIVVMVLIGLIARLTSEYTIIKKTERRRLNRCSWELYFIKQAIDQKLPSNKIIELKNYVRKVTA